MSVVARSARHLERIDSGIESATLHLVRTLHVKVEVAKDLESVMMSKCHVLFLATSLVAMLASASVGQELPSQNEHIKGLEPFIGFWEGEAPNTGGTLNVWGRWASNNSFAQFQFFLRGGDERTHIGTVIVGYSGENQQVKMWGFWPDSVIQGKVAEVGDGTLTYQSEGVTADGAKTGADVTWKADGDEVTINIANQHSDGEERPEMQVTLKRRDRPNRRN